MLRLKLPARSSIAIERDGDVMASWTDPRIPDLHIICGDAISWLETFKPVGDEFIYCDPPYLFSTRSGGAIYRHELSDAEHRHLLSILKRLRCSIAISGYWSPMYARALSKWRATQFLTSKRNHARSEEWLWMNYPEPIALHDYRYLGSNFRERERIKRKKLRWKRRLAAMSILERRALVATLAEVEDSRSTNGVFGEVGRTSTISGCIDGNGDATRLKVSGRHRRRERLLPAPIA